MSLPQELYQGAATIGYIQSDITAVVFVLIGVVLLFLGYNQWSTYRGHTMATVSNVTSGSFTINYSVGGVMYSEVAQQQNADQKYVSGQKISILYNLSNPHDYSLYPYGTMGLVGFGLLMIVFGLGYYYFIHKYKLLAAATGTKTALSYITGGRL